jgi:hypothetical protein
LHEAKGFSPQAKGRAQATRGLQLFSREAKDFRPGENARVADFIVAEFFEIKISF